MTSLWQSVILTWIYPLVMYHFTFVKATSLSWDWHEPNQEDRTPFNRWKTWAPKAQSQAQVAEAKVTQQVAVLQEPWKHHGTCSGMPFTASCANDLFSFREAIFKSPAWETDYFNIPMNILHMRYVHHPWEFWPIRLMGTHDEDAPTEIVMRTLDYKMAFFVLFCCYFICKEERNSSQ